jgi:hypothetical protein
MCETHTYLEHDEFKRMKASFLGKALCLITDYDQLKVLDLDNKEMQTHAKLSGI